MDFTELMFSVYIEPQGARVVNPLTVNGLRLTAKCRFGGLNGRFSG
jgi:hypothetical protein